MTDRRADFRQPSSRQAAAKRPPDDAARSQPDHDTVALGLCLFDARARVVACNDCYVHMHGLSPGQVRPGCTLLDVVALQNARERFIEEPEKYAAGVLAAIRRGTSFRHVTNLADGRTISVAHEPMPDGGWIAVHADTTGRRQVEEELRRTQTFFDTVIENMPVGLWVEDAKDFRLLLTNKVGVDIMGMPRELAIGKTAYDILPKEEADWVAAHNREIIESSTSGEMGEQWFHTSPDGPRLISSKKLVIHGDDGKPQYLLSLGEDVTERRRAEEQIAHLAHHDPLTNLPNRAAFTERLIFALERAADAGESFALMCLDLDRFKEVNDVFGHAVGDELLRQVSRRMEEACEGAFVARLGGDEFMAMTSAGAAQPAAAATLADRLVAITGEDFEIEGNRLRLGVSIGVAIYPDDGLDGTTLLGNADAALYRAKVEGRGLIRFFEPEMDERLRERRALQHDLRTAIENNELKLYYQPQARIDGEITGFEALVRWQHPTRGLVPPNTFIPIAEESGLMIHLGEWVLREACREAASWARPLQIAINLSPVQFRHGDLPGLVHSVLLETGLAARRVELEITEGVLISDFSRAVSILRRLKSLGVRIAMDDFGTGYSSLAYLQSFPFDKIKIDQAFISNLERNPQSAAIVRAVIGLGRGLDLPVVAEGVETSEQLTFLAKEFCDEVQGYYVGRPWPISRYTDLVHDTGAAEKKFAQAE